MYLVAHRVRSVHNEVGINVFLHSHTESEMPEEFSWAEPDVELIAEAYPGQKLAESVEVAPGGNLVLSYLDIAADDGADSGSIAAVLDRFEPRVLEARRPLVFTQAIVSLRFGAQPGLGGQLREEYRTLKDRALHLLKHPTPPPWRMRSPLVVEMDARDGERSFFLSPESIERLREVHQGSWQPPRGVSIQLGGELELRKELVDIFNHVVPLLTDLSVKQVAGLGGVMLRDRVTGQDARWPQE